MSLAHAFALATDFIEKNCITLIGDKGVLRDFSQSIFIQLNSTVK